MPAWKCDRKRPAGSGGHGQVLQEASRNRQPKSQGCTPSPLYCPTDNHFPPMFLCIPFYHLFKMTVCQHLETLLIVMRRELLTAYSAWDRPIQLSMWPKMLSLKPENPCTTAQIPCGIPLAVVLKQKVAEYRLVFILP